MDPKAKKTLNRLAQLVGKLPKNLLADGTLRKE